MTRPLARPEARAHFACRAWPATIAAVLATCLATAGPAHAAVGAAQTPGNGMAQIPAGQPLEPLPGAPTQLVAVVHAHTSASTGNASPAQISRMAREAGVDLVVLTENFAYRFRYAPYPLRYFFEALRSTPMLEDYGIERYLREIAETQRQSSSPMLLVGVEAPPYYYWTGSLLNGDLTLRDMQRNVLVIAPTSGEDESGGFASGRSGSADATHLQHDADVIRSFLEGLPLAGNRYYRRFGWGSLALLLPGLMACFWSLRRLRQRGAFEPGAYRGSYRLSESAGRYIRTRPVYRHVGYWLQVIVLVAGAALLYANFPFTAPGLDPYDADAGFGLFEELFDHVAAEDGLTFWSMPEAVDHHDLSVGPFAVTLETERYEAALWATEGYTGFGGVYADTTTAERPGGAWDRALVEFVRGERPAAPTMIGESSFHYSGQAGKRLDDILTVLLVPKLTHRAAFEALSSGRSYTVSRRAGSPDLRLTEAAVSIVGAANPADPGVARPGDTLRISGSEIELTVRVDDTSGAAVPVDIEVVRDGTVERSWSATTPFERRWLEVLEADVEHTYYRMIVRASNAAYIVANPIFVRREKRP